MTQKLNSPGMTSFESQASISTIRGASTGIALAIGIAEWGEIGKPTVCVSFTDFVKKFGGFLSGYYLAKCADMFFKEGGSTLYVVRTAHYTAGVLDAVKASLTVKGYNSGEEDRPKVNTIKFEATGEGVRGNKINLSNKKAETTLNGALTAASHDSAVLTDASDFEVGDVVDINDGTNYVRVVITAININAIYFKSMTLATEIGDGATVKTASTHIVRTALEEDLSSNATSAKLSNINGVSIGSVITIVDTQEGAPNSVTVTVTSISQNVISFADIGTITTITAGNSEVVSQEFDLTINKNVNDQEKTITYISMVPENEANYIENKVSSDYITASDLASTENVIGDLPEVFDLEYLIGGDDGLTGLTDADFSGNEAYKNGLYAFDSLPDMFAQIFSPDNRSAAFQNSLKNYAEARGLWAELDVDFGKTPEEAKEYVLNTAMLNTNCAEINYPNVKWRNPNTNVVVDCPQSGATAGLNARIWSSLGKGPWIAPAGVENGVYKSIEGFESNYTEDKDWRDLLYDARINALYPFVGYGNVKYGIRTLESSGQFPQVPERVTFLYCRHSIINGTPWVVFSLIDDSTFKRIKRTVRKFLLGVWRSGGLKGATEEEAFEIDLDSVNTTDTEDLGEIWCRIGLATKKAGEFVYFEFQKKIGG